MEQLETDPVPLGTSHIPSHIPPRSCGGLCFKRPCASRRDTPHERARARDEHHSPAMPTAHAFYARNGARDPERAGFRVSHSSTTNTPRRPVRSSNYVWTRAARAISNPQMNTLKWCEHGGATEELLQSDHGTWPLTANGCVRDDGELNINLPAPCQ